MQLHSRVGIIKYVQRAIGYYGDHVEEIAIDA